MSEFIKPPKKILLIVNQQIGDVLLSTPLLRAMRIAWPQAVIDVLVYENTAGILAGNPDCNGIITVVHRPNLSGYWQLLKKILRRYDLAVSTQGNDRAHQYMFFAAPLRFGLMPDLSRRTRLKRMVCSAWTLLDEAHLHTVSQNNLLALKMGIAPCYDIVPPKDNHARKTLSALLQFNIETNPYIVIHPRPMWQYKCWTDAGWQALISNLVTTGKKIIVTGGPSAEEQTYCADLANLYPDAVISIAGKTSFAELATLLVYADAYIGPDTVTTHLAAACGTPTLAIFGPTNPVKWGPWPRALQSETSPWQSIAPLQKIGNVTLLQGLGDCVPCHSAGCEDHNNSDSQCLNELPASRVIEAFNGTNTNFRKIIPIRVRV